MKNSLIYFIFLFVAFLSFNHVALADKKIATESIIIDNGLHISKEELEEAMKYWPEKDRLAAFTDNGMRFQLLSRFIQNRKVSDKLEKMTKESDPVFYWQQKFAVRNLQANLYLKNYKDNLVVPDMTELAKERLLVNKDKYTKNPEERMASHILVMCKPGLCDRDEKRPEAQQILDKLESGESFEELVAKYSEDPGSKLRKGKLNSWIRLAGKRMDPHFVGGVFSIKEVGGYSDLVETQFGFHIIRLDKIKPVSYKPEEYVLPGIVEQLEKEYRHLSEVVFTNDLILSENSIVDDAAITELLSGYQNKKKEEKPKARPKVTIKQFERPK
ncbi:peptidylprolyl isomerase [Cocleimonas sp. KMM 6892]|uniref:foldase protein PrsA n=1 Tax=unclassified Cocleimonas TaxID=2639732 RepID=UPI002DBC7420|nr:MULTISPECIES: peptidylprolyl isomerase [unclassified Cocleimonas]MEB8430927.1 peptidylprolyl isomerase [Cocleimonas sp. KMM 6892]MEC4714301.1 peptidylprolyl isomerase [Cocleimonas sp. KMM 6895]MEC4743632.1 peptidylprolyl isomerase [Cocleimonas sp. KMM 6896]